MSDLKIPAKKESKKVFQGIKLSRIHRADGSIFAADEFNVFTPVTDEDKELVAYFKSIGRIQEIDPSETQEEESKPE